MLRESKLLVLLGLILNGCGSTDNPEHIGPALWSLQGTITDTTDVARQNVRAAFVWSSQRMDHTGMDDIRNPNDVVQDIAVTAEFPSDFTIDIRDLPPQNVMSDPGNSEDGSSWALGRVIFYEDLDGSGSLTFVDICARQFVDKLIENDEQYEALYFQPGAEGALPPEFDFPDVQSGMNIYKTVAQGFTRISPVSFPDDTLQYALDVSLGDGDDERITTCETYSYLSSGDDGERYLERCGAQSLEELLCINVLAE